MPNATLSPVLKALMDKFTDATLRAAVAYVKEHKPTLYADTDACAEAISAALRDTIGDAFIAAYKDAREAYNLGMRDAGDATFKASAILTGITAAKRITTGC